MLYIIIASLSLIGFVAASIKLITLKKDGKLPSIAAFFSVLPVVFKTMKYKFIQKKIKKNKYIIALGKGGNEFTEDNYRLADHWKARETDVICAVPMKSGTTWCQQMCQQLRVNGDENVNYYQDLADVQPWLETRLTGFFGNDTGRPIPPDPAAGPGATDMNADHADSDIRVFKSHLPFKAFNGTNCKIIYFYRHDVSALYSLYRFVCGGIFECLDKCTAHQFCTICLLVGIMDTHMNSLCEFWENRHDQCLGFFFYEDVVEDHEGSAIRIAKLMGIEPKPKLIKKVVEQSTVEFMSAKEHHLRFDEFTNVGVMKRAHGLDYSYWPKVSGQKPEKEVPRLKVATKEEKAKRKNPEGKEELMACFERAWARIVLPRTGFATYADMRVAWKKELISINS